MSGNFWVLVGNSGYTEKQWGIERIDFPVAYQIPRHAVSGEDRCLSIPHFADDLSIFSGLAIEISKEGRNISVHDARDYIAGCRVWTGLHSHDLIHTLKRLGHQVRVRDYGISAYYGQWMERFHAVGDLLHEQFLEEGWRSPLTLVSSSGKSTRMEPSDYISDPSTVVGFFSRFMTLRKGDRFALGALCGLAVERNVKSFKTVWAGNELEVTLEDLREQEDVPS